MSYAVEPVGFVHASRVTPEDDLWGGEQSRIILANSVPKEVGREEDIQCA